MISWFTWAVSTLVGWIVFSEVLPTLSCERLTYSSPLPCVCPSQWDQLTFYQTDTCLGHVTCFGQQNTSWRDLHKAMGSISIFPSIIKLTFTEQRFLLHVCVLSLFSRIWLADPMDAPLSMGSSWQEHWSGLPDCPAGDLPDPGKICCSSSLFLNEDDVEQSPSWHISQVRNKLLFFQD